MDAILPERSKRPGVCYAVTDDGIELPIIDTTHPAFAEQHTADELAALAESTIRNLRHSRWIPHFVHRIIARNSLLLRGTLDAMGGVLGGMPTYLLKIGPDNLGAAYAVPLDRKIASALTPVAMRLRLRDVAASIAAGIAARLRATPGRPVHLVNIGGGTAIDSTNALLILARDEGAMLRETPFRLDILDIDAHAPGFGLRALDALRMDGKPLSGVDLHARHIVYDWSDTTPLRNALAEAAAGDPLVAVSSEGGLFEYGSDADISENLTTLHTHAAADCFMVASTIRDVPIARVNRERSRMPIRIMRTEQLAGLVARAGWSIDADSGGNPMYEVHLLTPLGGRG